ncbi:RNA polymerase sigma factor [Pedobacter rhodius]|uniref:Sigma-70 family RNA polymerase sigma factor n=1 Tax=Pedobacter rhodius TaxID=3004098 RepID=A0ABT4KW44_9SPHI|nr:sigma-70 family RNA polymerase sigma factor [Pedobacter sp. SJ11]MCZ4223148.1 sigma-70 family RNA polymerase sigma factor [Pedobacter sp. SJ11]
MSFNHIPDNEASNMEWNAFKKGDWEAYKQLYNSHFKILNNYGYKFTRDSSMIEDAVHDLFVNLWNKREQLANPVSVKNYLYKSLRNLLFRKLDKQQRFVNIESDEDYPFNFEVSFDTILIENESEKALQRKIKEAVQSLPARQQEIIYLKFYENLSYEEIADIMNLNINSAYKLLYKAVGKLQEKIKHSDLLIILCLTLSESAISKIN